MALVTFVATLATACGVSRSNPPHELTGRDLVGVWLGRYSKGAVDRIEILSDGTFAQIHVAGKYRFAVSGNFIWLERLADGRVWAHLPGARYYVLAQLPQLRDETRVKTRLRLVLRAGLSVVSPAGAPEPRVV